MLLGRPFVARLAAKDAKSCEPEMSAAVERLAMVQTLACFGTPHEPQLEDRAMPVEWRASVKSRDQPNAPGML